jgi:PAS domain S-box-containing protein
MDRSNLLIPSQSLAADLQDMQILHNLSLHLVSEDNLQVFYNAVMGAAIALTRADAGTVQILDEATQELMLLATQGFDARFVDQFQCVNASSTTSCGIALATGQRTYVDFDDPTSNDYDGSLQLHIEAGYLSAQSTPLITRDGKAIGMFSTHWRKHHRPGERELRHLDLLARQAADLIERARSQAELRKSEEKYRTLFNSIDAGFCVVEVRFDEQQTALDYRFLEVNPAFERQTGLHNALGRWASDLVPGLEQHWFDVYGRVAWTGEATRFENIAEPMGRSFDVYAFRTGAAADHHVAILFNDVTERKRAEEALRQIEQRRLMAVEASGVGDWEYNPTTGDIYWSPRMYELHGLPPDGIPVTLEMITRLAHPDDSPVVLEAHYQAMTGVNNGKYVGHYRVTHPDGQTHWLESRGNVAFEERNEQRIPVRVMGTVLDITARKQVEGIEREKRILAEALRDTAEELGSTLKLPEVINRALMVAHWLIDFDTAYIILSEGDVMTHFQGDHLSAREEVVLAQWHRQHGTLSEVPLYQMSSQSRKVLLISDVRQLKQTLPLRSLKALFVLPIITYRQEMFGYMVLINRTHNDFDETDTVALQAFAYQLATALSNAQLFLEAQELAALKERQQFARDLHDAVSQTLFTASIMTEALPQMWERRSQEVPQLLGDVNRLIRGAQAEMRSLLLELRPASLQFTPLTRLLEQLIAAMRGRKQVQIDMTTDGEPVLPQGVHMVVYRIAQETMNNVTKHAHADHVWIKVSGNKGFVELSIRDNGIGFESDDETPGLGLQMMQERAHEIDARLDINSHPGAGTEVRIVWPQGS